MKELIFILLLGKYKEYKFDFNFKIFRSVLRMIPNETKLAPHHA